MKTDCEMQLQTTHSHLAEKDYSPKKKKKKSTKHVGPAHFLPTLLQIAQSCSSVMLGRAVGLFYNNEIPTLPFDL